ncbi:synapsin-1-like [Ailuropoda melanoleuca]|uniref:synapsin-1-like n=1 Tax=Ailuropoda melanoleuca TaxID=9646 RepID=UPI00149455DF|nr:synapsin-1-like [Ailuropoda melanoleuca]
MVWPQIGHRARTGRSRAPAPDGQWGCQQHSQAPEQHPPNINPKALLSPNILPLIPGIITPPPSSDCPRICHKTESFEGPAWVTPACTREMFPRTALRTARRDGPASPRFLPRPPGGAVRVRARPPRRALSSAPGAVREEVAAPARGWRSGGGPRRQGGWRLRAPRPTGGSLGKPRRSLAELAGRGRSSPCPERGQA